MLQLITNLFIYLIFLIYFNGLRYLQMKYLKRD